MGIQMDPVIVNWQEQESMSEEEVRVQLFLWPVHFYISG